MKYIASILHQLYRSLAHLIFATSNGLISLAVLSLRYVTK